LVIEPGNRISRNLGRGFDPMTLSTAIFRGIGVSRASGVARSPSRKIKDIWSQKGFV
jgi:hypothetical protein